MSTPLLEVIHIYKSFDGAPLLRDVSFDVAPSEIVCLLGPSGCGKTTLLNIIAGLEQVENDQVTFRYKTNSGQTKFCTMPVEKFIHRFLQHVLPKSFVKVRYYGLFSPAHRQQLETLRPQLAARPAAAPAQTDAVDSKSPPDSSSSTSPSSRSVRCPACGHIMQLQATLPPLGRAPP
jgi:ABC-type branched-subunit amino acid transport system ATPase component